MKTKVVRAAVARDEKCLSNVCLAMCLSFVCWVVKCSQNLGGRGAFIYDGGFMKKP